MRSWIVSVALLPLTVAAATPPRPKLAVLELKAGQGLSEREARTLTTLVSTDGARGGLEVIAQSEGISHSTRQRGR
jgi:hypothetical protein